MPKVTEGKQRQKHKELNLIPRTPVRREQANCWALLTSQPGPFGDFRPVREPASKIRWIVLEAILWAPHENITTQTYVHPGTSEHTKNNKHDH